MNRTWTYLFLLAMVVTASQAWSLGNSSIFGTTTETQIREQAVIIDVMAAGTTDAAVAQRLSTTFGVSADALLQERATAAVGWSDLFVARTILANSRTSLTSGDLLQMRTSGLTWTQIARSLNMSPLRLSRALAVESRMLDRAQGSLTTTTSRNLGTQAAVRTSATTVANPTAIDVSIAQRLARRPGMTMTADDFLTLRATGQSWVQIARGAGIPYGVLLITARQSGVGETYLFLGTTSGTTGTTGTVATGTTGGTTTASGTTTTSGGTVASGTGTVTSGAITRTRGLARGHLKTTTKTTRGNHGIKATSRGGMKSTTCGLTQAGTRGAMMRAMHSQAALRAATRVQKTMMVNSAIRAVGRVHK